MKMTAAVMHEQGLPKPYRVTQPFRIEEVDLSGPGEMEVLVEVRAAGLCHSDLSQVAGLRKRKLPVVGGHEGAGIVREVGRGVTRLRPGDHVVMTAGSGCGHCPSCADSHPAMCDNVGIARAQGLLPNGAVRLSQAGAPVFHYSGISSFAEYAVTQPQALIKLEPSMPLDVAALFGCAVVTGVGSVLNAAKVRPGQSVAVIGLGGVGLNAVMAAKLAGASQIIGIEIAPSKFALAQDLGCTQCFDAKDPDLVEAIRDLTHGGVKYVFEISGAKSAMATAFAITRKGGDVVCVGLGATGDIYGYPHSELVGQGKALRGVFLGDCVPERDIPLYLRLFSEGKLPVDKLLSGHMQFATLNATLDQLDQGQVLRQVLLPHSTVL